MLFFWAQDARTRCQLVKYLPTCVCLPLCLASVNTEKVRQTHWAYHLAACMCVKTSEAREQELEEWHALISKDVINNNQAGESWETCCLCSHVPQKRWLVGRRHTPDNRQQQRGCRTSHGLFLLSHKEDKLQSQTRKWKMLISNVV